MQTSTSFLRLTMLYDRTLFTFRKAAEDMGIKERQERDREAVRRSILDAARELFVNEGYHNVSIRKIAERIGIQPGSALRLLSFEGRHLLCARRGRLPSAASASRPCRPLGISLSTPFAGCSGTSGSSASNNPILRADVLGQVGTVDSTGLRAIRLRAGDQARADVPPSARHR